MTDPASTEIRDLLAEIRDLLKPVADAYRDEYEKRLAQREAARMAALKDLLRNAKRAKAWQLADGSRNQGQIARQAGLDKSALSKFFKTLRELNAVSDAPRPKRIVEVKDGG